MNHDIAHFELLAKIKQDYPTAIFIQSNGKTQAFGKIGLDTLPIDDSVIKDSFAQELMLMLSRLEVFSFNPRSIQRWATEFKVNGLKHKVIVETIPRKGSGFMAIIKFVQPTFRPEGNKP